jgi:P27 family predicted phage terminase small subunit
VSYEAPDHLQPATAAWWLKTAEFFELEPSQCRVLTCAASAWDRMEAARQILSAEGLVIKDKLGTPKQHPAVAIERDSRQAFLRCLRDLNLDRITVPRECDVDDEEPFERSDFA